MAKSRNGLIATAITAVSFILVVIAFSTPYWLETDNKLEKPTFRRLGLWEVCFTDFQEPHFWYDTKFNSCWWVFEEEFYIVYDFLLPGFFTAVQFFFTLCLTIHLIAIGFVGLYMACSRENDQFVNLLFFLGSLLIVAGLSGAIAVGIFGGYGDRRDWMPHWEHNNIGWSYALAVIGTMGSLIAGVLFGVEGRRHLIKRRRLAQSRGSYQMDERKYGWGSE